MLTRKKGFRPIHPKQCPGGHKNLSWSFNDDNVYCWDCGRSYPFSECVDSRSDVIVASRERRVYSRVEVSWPVGMLTSEGLVEGEVKNISFEGAGIQCRELPKIDEPLDLDMLIPEHDHSSVSASVEVIWSRTYESGDASPLANLGVRFLEISDEDMKLVSRTALI